MKLGHSPICLLAVFCLPAFATLAQPQITIQILSTFDYPGTGNSTTPQGINNRGDIAGHFTDSLGANRGFLRLKNGNFSPPIVEPNDTGNLTAPAWHQQLAHGLRIFPLRGR